MINQPQDDALWHGDEAVYWIVKNFVLGAFIHSVFEPTPTLPEYSGRDLSRTDVLGFPLLLFQYYQVHGFQNEVPLDLFS